MSDHIQRIDRVRGALLGGVLGDAFGGPLEGAPPTSAARLALRRAQAPRRWGYTDDGAMLIAACESIRDAGTVDPAALLSAMTARYEPARGFGRGMKMALQAYARGTRWQDVAHTAWPEGSRGNGGAVRAGAFALRSWISVGDLITATQCGTIVTHSHPEAIDAAVMQAWAVAKLVEGAAPDVHLLDGVEHVLAETSALARVIPTLRSTLGSELDVTATFGTSPLAAESVPAALTVFLRSPDDYEAAIVNAAALGGDVDSICAMVGCLSGASVGYRRLPKSWLASLERESPCPALLVELADAVAALPAIRFEPPSK